MQSARGACTMEDKSKGESPESAPGHPGGEGIMKTMTWTKRITISAGLALTSLVAVPAVAGADGCYTGCTPPVVHNTSVTPPADGTTTPVQTTAQVDGSSSLPFTGADIGELAVVGAGAVAIGVVMTRRRRSAS